MVARKSEKVTTATLVRGRIYVYKGQFFERGKPIVVDDALAAELEDLVEEVTDSDEDIFEKPFFSVDYEADPPLPPKQQDKKEPRVRRRRHRPADEEEDEAEERRPRRLMKRRRR